MKKSLLWILVLIFVSTIVSFSLAESKIDVGIVLPTKDEPRWIQDETYFNDALKTAGYSAEILFSQGSPAKEKENVEALITKGAKVLIICPHDSTAAAASADEARAAGIKGHFL